MALAVLLVLILVACNKSDQSSSIAAPPASQTPAASAAVSDDTVAQSQPQQVEGLQPLPVASGVSALTGLALPEGMGAEQRPVAVMVLNTERARPQRGLAAADVVIETLVEGDTTRLMALYTDYRAVPQVGPVAATHDQFVQMATPANAIQVHIGTTVYARNLFTVLGEKDIDGMYLGRTCFVFDHERSLPKPGGKLNEYCWFTDAGFIWTGIESTNITTVAENHSLFNFTQEPAAGGVDGSVISLSYTNTAWGGFNYNTETGLYDKSAFGSAHTDEDGTPLSYKNVLVLNCPITLKPDGWNVEFDLRGSTGWYFTAGGVTPLFWQKGGPTDALRLFTAEG